MFGAEDGWENKDPEYPLDLLHPDRIKLASVKKLVEDWIAKQGHEACWYYPDIFADICIELGIEWKEPSLPPRSEFEKGCCKFQKEIYD